MDSHVLERVLEITHRMAQTRHLDPLLDYAMWEAINLVRAERGFLVLIGEDGQLEFRVQRDKDGQRIKAAQDQVSMSILNQVIRTGKPILLEDALSDPSFSASSSVLELKLHSVMCVPLITRGSVIGAIFVENRSVRGMFRQEDLMPLYFFSNQAAVSIENAMLNEELEARVTARTAELKQAMEQLERSWREAVEVNRFRTTFLSNIAHDIRAPIGLAVAAIDMLREGIFGEINQDQLEWLNKSLEALNHASALIADMFDLIKLDMGQLRLDPQSMNLEGFLRNIYAVGEGLPWPEGVEFKLSLQPHLPSLSFDPTRIRQVLLNLLTNALKFTEKGEVTLYAQRLENQRKVLIGVTDTGMGIAPHNHEVIFERFRQVDDKTERRGLGSGMGLAICRELVELHHGKIWVESELGQGADFKFVLPY